MSFRSLFACMIAKHSAISISLAVLRSKFKFAIRLFLEPGLLANDHSTKTALLLESQERSFNEHG